MQDTHYKLQPSRPRHICNAYFYTSLQAELFDKNIKIHTVFPGFVRTNIAKNALVSNGDSFGKSDAKIESGLDPMEVVNRMLAGVYFNDSEIEVLNDWHMRFQALSARWFWFLHRWFALSNYRKQVEMCTTSSGSTTSAAAGTLNLNNPAGASTLKPGDHTDSSVASSARSSPSKTRRRKSIESANKFPPAIRVVPLNSPSVDSHSSFQNASHFTNTNNLHNYGGGASSNSNSVEEVSNENLPKRVQKQQVEYYEGAQLPLFLVCHAKLQIQAVPLGTVCMTSSGSPNSTTLQWKFLMQNPHSY